jgi:hypothetical protein
MQPNGGVPDRRTPPNISTELKGTAGRIRSECNAGRTKCDPGKPQVFDTVATCDTLTQRYGRNVMDATLWTQRYGRNVMDATNQRLRDEIES